MVRYLMARYGIGAKRACGCIRFRRSVYYYRSCRDPLVALRQRVREIAAGRVRFGYRRILMLLRREGWEEGCEPSLSRLLRGRVGLAAQAALAPCERRTAFATPADRRGE